MMSVARIAEALSDRFGLLSGGARARFPATKRSGRRSSGATSCYQSPSGLSFVASRFSPAG